MSVALFLLAAACLVSGLVLVDGLQAGNPHFVGKLKITRVGDSITICGKEAGLGNETQVHIEISGAAQCINPGGNEPQADNKDTFSAAGDFPVQNGKAEFCLTLTADLQPNCTPPMTLEWSDIVVEDSEHGLREDLPGTY